MVPAGHYLMADQGNVKVKRYWELHFPEEVAPGLREDSRDLESYLDEFRSLLIDATQIRLRADVPVGAYLSGGVDSSTIAAIIRKYTGNRLDTFSISFNDPEFDESPYQLQMAGFLGTDHQVVYATYEILAGYSQR